MKKQELPSWDELLDEGSRQAENREADLRNTENREEETQQVGLRGAETRKAETRKAALRQSDSRKLEDRKVVLRNDRKQKPGKQKDEKQKPVKPGTRKVFIRKIGKRNSITFDKLDADVTVGAKASEHLAVHWATEAKRRRLPMSYVILHALIENFGLPEGTVLVEE
jgi:hypothetical protein